MRDKSSTRMPCSGPAHHDSPSAALSVVQASPALPVLENRLLQLASRSGCDLRCVSLPTEFVCGGVSLAHTIRLQGVKCEIVSADSYYMSPPPHVDPANHNFDEPAALELGLLAEHLVELKVRICWVERRPMRCSPPVLFARLVMRLKCHSTTSAPTSACLAPRRWRRQMCSLSMASSRSACASFGRWRWFLSVRALQMRHSPLWRCPCPGTPLTSASLSMRIQMCAWRAGFGVTLWSAAAMCRACWLSTSDL